jgi:hypothetical protein
MSKKKKQQQAHPNTNIARSIVNFVPRATAHGTLVDERVHVFVDDQNLFYGITNNLLLASSQMTTAFGRLRTIRASKCGGISGQQQQVKTGRRVFDH